MQSKRLNIAIATRLALLFLAASLLPLTIFGIIAIIQVHHATEISVTEGYANVSRRAAEEIDQYVSNALKILSSTSENMSQPDLQDWQRERILSNYINRFDEFNELVIRGRDSKLLATSRLTPREMTALEKEAMTKALSGETFLSPVFIKEDLTPAMLVTFPIKRLSEVNSVLFAELNLLHMWYLVDSIRIGERGVIHVVDTAGNLIATGDGERKQEVFQGKTYEASDLLSRILESKGFVFKNARGVKVLTVGTRLKPPLSWSIIVSQPTSEAYRLAYQISYILLGVMGGMILIALGFGYWGGRRYVVTPLHALMEATEQLALGNLDHRVLLNTGDEFTKLGDAFNQMGVRLKELQEKLILEERHAMFGRIASGLAHDLKHPIQAVENVSRLMEKMYDDSEFRETFRRTVEREFTKISLFLQNLHNLTHELPYHPMPLSAASLLQDAWATFEMEAKKQSMTSDIQLFQGEDVRVEGDRIALNRVFSNLISNAIQAMKQDGCISILGTATKDEVVIAIKDTGMGIPPERISKLFDDFVTTKRRGLGLGLAITRKIVAQHRGKIEVSSEVGVGTCFTIRLPRFKKG